METRPIHENLDTSFVNLAALLRYLRRRQFVGHIRVELSGYEADIHLLADNKMQVREHDRIAGRVADGEEALQRLLIRAREPGGTIHVYQVVAETQTAPPKPDKEPGVEPPPAAAEALTVETETNLNGRPKSTSNGNGHHAQRTTGKPEKPAINLPDFPFALSNQVESKARRTQQLSPEDWQMLMRLTAELLGTIDRSLAEANLNFSAAFAKARTEIAADYPFLNPVANVFDYSGGKIIMRGQVSAKLFVASINEALRRILEKLGSNPKFSLVYRATVQKIIALIQQRKPLYQKFNITPQLEKVIGI